jgi:hypothetical protein
MTDPLTSEIGSRPATDANDCELSRVLNDALNNMDRDRMRNAYLPTRDIPLEQRIENLEAALLALATVVSRRLGL